MVVSTEDPLEIHNNVRGMDLLLLGSYNRLIFNSTNEVKLVAG